MAALSYELFIIYDLFENVDFLRIIEFFIEVYNM